MSLLRPQPRRADRRARAHGPVPVPPVIPVLVAHIADDGAMRVTLDGQPHEPQAFVSSWMRHHLVAIVNDIIGERNSPVRVIIHEADGAEYDDIVAEPLDELGIVPRQPTPYWGWGAMPDQYGRRFEDDDGEGAIPKNPVLKDLPPLEPWWGPRMR